MTRKEADQYCEWGVIGLVIAIVSFGVLATGATRPIDFLVLQSLTALALGLWSLRFLLNDNHRLLWPPVAWAVVIFVGLAWYRYSQADLEYVARYEVFKISVYAALFFLALNNLHKQETTQVLVFVLLTIGTAISLYAVYQFFTHAQTVWSFQRPAQYWERGSGSYICPNHLAGFLELIFPLGVAYLFAGRYNYTFKVFLGYGCMVILVGIAVTLSRGGWLATGLALGVLFALLLRKRQHRIPAIAALLIFLTAGAILYQRSEKLQERVQKMNEGGSDADVSARPAIWKGAWAMWQDHQLWGVGPAHFDYRFPEYRTLPIQVRPGRVHNDYLNLLVDWGLIGTLPVVVGGLLLVVGVWQSRKYVERASRDLGNSRNSNRSAFVLGIIGSMTALAVHSLFDFNLHVPANAAVATVLFALAASHLRFSSGRYWLTAWPGSKFLYAALLLAAAGYLGQAAVRAFPEQRLLLKAAEEQPASMEQIRLLQQAAHLEPANFENLYTIGESLRARGMSIPENATENLEAAIDWFEAAAAVYPTWAYNQTGIGMSLDHLNRFDEATPYFEAAVRLDPNQYQIVGFMGWHQVNLGDFEAAKEYFERSLQIKWWDNHLSFTYLRLVKEQLGIEDTATP